MLPWAEPLLEPPTFHVREAVQIQGHLVAIQALVDLYPRRQQMILTVLGPLAE